MTSTATANVNVASLVEDDLLDLDAVFDGAGWDVADDITTYTACVYGHDGCQPGEVEIVLESATAYGITAWRWVERDGCGADEHGDITLDRDEAIAGGREYAEEQDDEPDEDDLIQRVVDTGYFGDADASDIRAVCEEATKHSQGYLLLPAGVPTRRPVGRMWTTNGYLQCAYVSLRATYSRVSYAAAALLAAVEEAESDDDD